MDAGFPVLIGYAYSFRWGFFSFNQPVRPADGEGLYYCTYELVQRERGRGSDIS